jgi:hypothetical protein
VADSGVRRALDCAADRAIGSRHAEVVYLASMCVTSVVAAILLRIGRHLSR